MPRYLYSYFSEGAELFPASTVIEGDLTLLVLAS